ncbi:MAG: phosphomethylpyrimidine synthase ThiC [Candidatus Saganbacteria bacterium]|nr:phosphomethylpyrimidine synthase ThiC [Candidatus Saganbacteria bacterium]
MTQRQEAINGNVTNAMQYVADAEKVSPEVIRKGIADGTIAIPYNPLHKKCIPMGVGRGLRTKVNANFGTSQDYPCIEDELKKLEVSIAAKADAVMDLSTGGDINAIRRAIIERSPLCLGTVPIYQAIAEEKFSVDGIFDVIEEQAKDGVDFMTVHTGVTFDSIAKLKKHPRLMEVVSRGGALMMQWIIENKEENPLYKHYDRLLEIAVKYDVTLSLGDGMRPGSIVDAGDPAQIEELKILGKLTKRAWDAGVQIIIEGPGHVPYDQIVEQMKMEKEFCFNAPFYVLGPLPTDVAPGYDHITSAIGGTLAAVSGADFLCYVTPTEHLGLPTPEDVKEGIIASRIAAHCADIVKKVPGAIEWDREMSTARKKLDWNKQIELAIDPEKAKKILAKRPTSQGTCSMCGKFCAMKVSTEALKK